MGSAIVPFDELSAGFVSRQPGHGDGDVATISNSGSASDRSDSNMPALFVVFGGRKTHNDAHSRRVRQTSSLSDCATAPPAAACAQQLEDSEAASPQSAQETGSVEVLHGGSTSGW